MQSPFVHTAFITTTHQLPIRSQPGPVFSSSRLGRTCTAHPPCMASRKSKRQKRPRSSDKSAGFSSPASSAPEPPPPPPSEPEEPTRPSGPDLQKRDASGISLGDRLREEIAHPLRKPKLTLFGTLAFSGLVGLFFAVARLNKDGITQVSQNVAIDVAAVALFAWLAWREVQFGRRSLNSLAGQPQARDLEVVMLGEDTSVVGGKMRRVSDFGRGGVVVIVAGRAADLRKYVGRIAEEGGQRGAEKVVLFATDARGDGEDNFEGADAVGSGEVEKARDWIAWLGDAIPPKRNVALFRIESSDMATNAASSYVVAVGEPASVPLPVDAKRELSEV